MLQISACCGKVVFYLKGLNVIYNILHHQCSSPNVYLIREHMYNKCNCIGAFEDGIHYFLECSLCLFRVIM